MLIPLTVKLHAQPLVLSCHCIRAVSVSEWRKQYCRLVESVGIASLGDKKSQVGLCWKKPWQAYLYCSRYVRSSILFWLYSRSVRLGLFFYFTVIAGSHASPQRKQQYAYRYTLLAVAYDADASISAFNTVQAAVCLASRDLFSAPCT